MKYLRTGAFAAILGLATAGAAFADAPTAEPAATTQVTLPTGKTIDAQKFVDPPEGSVEHAMIQSMNMIKAGNFDAWVGQYCHPNTCPDKQAIDALKAYQLKSSSKTVHECMTDDGGVLVTKREEDEAQGGFRIYVFCGENRMPAPSSLIKADGSWKVASFSW